MKRMWLRLSLLVSLIAGLFLMTAGCSGDGVGSGASLKLEGLTLGTLSMEGKEVSGLPSEKVNLMLDVSARSIIVSSDSEGIVLTAEPSGATVEITGDGVSIKGLKPEKIKVEWQGTEE